MRNIMAALAASLLLICPAFSDSRDEGLPKTTPTIAVDNRTVTIPPCQRSTDMDGWHGLWYGRWDVGQEAYMCIPVEGTTMTRAWGPYRPLGVVASGGAYSFSISGTSLTYEAAGRKVRCTHETSSDTVTCKAKPPFRPEEVIHMRRIMIPSPEQVSAR